MVGGFGWMERRGVEYEWWMVGVYKGYCSAGDAGVARVTWARKLLGGF